MASTKDTALKFIIELGKNGKLLLGYILIQFPELGTNYPGLYSALQDFVAHVDWKTTLNLLIQLLLAVGALHRLQKILRAARE